MAIRHAKKEDLAEILDIYRHYVETTAYSFEYTAPSLEAFTARFMRITEQFPFYVWEEENAVLGYAYADLPFEREAYAWCAEPSIYLRPDARRKGIGRALYEALERALKKQGYRNLYGVITTENEDSIAFHKAVGYRLLATFPDCGFKMGAWHGVTWMEKQLNSVEMPTEKPLPYKDIVGTDQK